jgi:uncharacterized membrane protein
MSSDGEPLRVEIRAPRWMVILLLASLTINLLIVGAVGATAWRFRHGGHIAALQGMPGPGNVIGFAASLPPDRRMAIWRLTSEERRALRDQRARVRTARQELQASLLADPFDAARFENAQRLVYEAESLVRREVQKLVLTVVTGLDKNERAAFARWQADDGHRRGRSQRGFWRRPGQPDPDPDAPPVPRDPK